MLLSILIANWNTRDVLRQCLQSLYLTANNLEFETIVVDNASSDGSPAMLRQEFPQVIVVESPENIGFGRATNQAAAMASGKVWLLLNPDTILHPQAIQRMLAYLEDNPQIGAVGPRILNPDGSLQVSCSPSPTLAREAWRLFHLDNLVAYSRYPEKTLHSDLPQSVDVLLGACILLREEVYKGDERHPATGLFDEQFFVYSEEVDLCLRIRQAGWQIHWLPSALVTHYGGQSTRQAADQMFIELYRNKINYFRKHGATYSVSLYKAILYSAALARWLPGVLVADAPIGRWHNWKNISRQYRLLIRELPNL